MARVIFRECRIIDQRLDKYGIGEVELEVPEAEISKLVKEALDTEEQTPMPIIPGEMSPRIQSALNFHGMALPTAVVTEKLI